MTRCAPIVAATLRVAPGAPMIAPEAAIRSAALLPARTRSSRHVSRPAAAGAHDAPKKPSTIPAAVHRAHFVAGTLPRALDIPAIAEEAAIRPAAPLPARARRSQLVPCPAPSRKQSHESTRAGASRSSAARAYPIRAAPPAVHLASPADSTPRSSTAIAHRGIFVSQPGWRSLSAVGAHDAPKKPSTIPVAVHRTRFVVSAQLGSMCFSHPCSAPGCTSCIPS